MNALLRDAEAAKKALKHTSCILSVDEINDLIEELLSDRSEFERDYIDNIFYKLSHGHIDQRIEGKRKEIEFNSAFDLFTEDASIAEHNTFSEASKLILQGKPELIMAVYELAGYRYINEYYEDIAELETLLCPPHAA